MDLKLFLNGKRVLSATRYLRTRVTATCAALSASEWTSGTIKVWYDQPNDYWNAGEFEDIEALEKLLAEFTEPALLKEFAILGAV